MKTLTFVMAVVSAICFVATTPVVAGVWYILEDGSGDEPTIQAGLDACAEGDTVLVAAGTFNENLVWPATEGIVLMSESGSGATVIDGGQMSHVITLSTGVQETTRIEGFTIRNGTAESGGGISCRDSSSPTITDNVIVLNHADLAGGGIYISSSSARVENNTIQQNDVTMGNTTGGGIGINGGSPTISGNLISENNGGGSAGGIGVIGDADPTVVDNTIIENEGYAGGGIMVQNSRGSYRQNLVCDNLATNIGGGFLLWTSKAELFNNRICRNTAEQINGGGGISIINRDSSLVDHCTITQNVALNEQGGGIQCQKQTGPTISNCTIEDNNGFGVYCNPNDGDPESIGGNPHIIHCNISQNQRGGVCNTDFRVLVIAQYNWWGDSSGPFHPALNFLGLGNEASDFVRFDPWETHPNTVDVQPGETPLLFTLDPNFPNPFNPQTTIGFTLERAQWVEVGVYDLGGRRMRVLANGSYVAGHHKVLWNGEDEAGRAMPSGSYVVRMETMSGVESQKVSLLR